MSFVVEDKTSMEMHGGQLERHRSVVGEDSVEEDLVKAVYFKTGYVFGDERMTMWWLLSDGWCVGQIEEMPEAISQGRTLEERVEMILDGKATVAAVEA